MAVLEIGLRRVVGVEEGTVVEGIFVVARGLLVCKLVGGWNILDLGGAEVRVGHV
jgi:hypothetical protein